MNNGFDMISMYITRIVAIITRRKVAIGTTEKYFFSVGAIYGLT